MGSRRPLVGVLVWSLLVLQGCEAGPDEKRDRIYELKKDPGPEEIGELRGYLDDEDPYVRATALYALVSSDVSGPVPLALEDLEDPHGFVRATAAKLLGDLGEPAAVAPLSERLVEDEDWVVRKRAADALGQLGNPAAAPALRQGLDDPVEDVRVAAVMAIAEIDPATAVDALIRSVREDPARRVREQAAHALGKSGRAEMASVLEEVADEDDNEFVRAAANNALEMLVGKGEPE